jgi:hypothetical protein
MKPLCIGLIGALTVALALADKKFLPGPASSYSSHQTNDNVTLAAVPYDTEELAHSAFGKLNPNQYGILPILVIIQNDTAQSLKLDPLEVEYVDTNRDRISPTPAEEVKYMGPGSKKPNMGVGPIPPGVIKHKSPLAAPEIETRAFSARMLPPHESASGFFYFQVHARPGSKFYLTGITDAASGKGLLYFEIPLDK